MVKKADIKNNRHSLLGVAYFILILLSAHFFWKFSFTYNEDETIITFYNFDLSNFFNLASFNVANNVHLLLNKIGYNTNLLANNVIIHQVSKHYAHVVWGCTSIKQMYIFICIILFYKGKWIHKIWYIPLGILLIYCFNIFRISFIIAIIDKHPEQFIFWHEYIMKYLFYIFIFLLWTFWDNHFTEKQSKVTKI